MVLPGMVQPGVQGMGLPRNPSIQGRTGRLLEQGMQQLAVHIQIAYRRGGPPQFLKQPEPAVSSLLQCSVALLAQQRLYQCLNATGPGA